MNKKVFSLLVCLGAVFCVESSYVKVPDKNKEVEHSFVLKVDENQEKIIREIILTMARSNPIKLGFKKKYLSGLGKKLKGLGPLQFLGYVGTELQLKKALNKISKSSLKWNGFVDGMSKGLNRAYEKKTLHRDLPGFASLVKVDEERLRGYAQKKDWSSFIQALAMKNSPVSSE